MRLMVYIRYMLSELGRRRGRTVLTALGLGVGVGLVIAVNALSAGLDDAQAKVLKPLTGVGTDMSVTRPISVSGTNGGFRQLSPQERAQLRRENGGGRRFGFQNLKPGQKFTRTFFQSGQLTFPASEVAKTKALQDVAAASGGLTLNLTTVSGTVPEQTPQSGGFGAPGGGAPGGGGGFNGPRAVNFSSTTVTGVQATGSGLGPISSDELSSGRWFTSGSKREAILDVSYARSKSLGVGDTIAISGKKFTVVGLVKTPLGGDSSDMYVKLAQLQKLSGRAGRINTLYVRAASSGDVSAVSKEISKSLPGASVTTAQTLADRVSGSLTSARNLTSKLGVVLELVGLIGAVLIAALLTLASVSKRVRELGTLKALGWSQRLVVRQVTGESVLQGLLGGAVGVVLGLLGAVLITALAPGLKATFASAASDVGFPGPGAAGGGGPFGQGAVAQAASETVHLTAHVSLGLIVAAVALAVAAGLLSGALGAFRAARLRPAEALRHVE